MLCTELLYAFEVRTSDKTSMGDAVSNFMGEAAGEGNEGSGKDSSAAPKSSTSLPATSQSVVTSTTKPSHCQHSLSSCCSFL